MRISVIAFSLTGAALLCGCAGTSQLLTQLPDRDVDAAKVASINRVAQAHSVEVHWVHYPLKRATETAAAPEAATQAGT